MTSKNHKLISISIKNAKKLEVLKISKREFYDDVIGRLLDEKENEKQK